MDVHRVCDGKGTYRRDQDFKSKKTKEIFDKINHILNDIPIGRIRKFIANSILYCHLYEGGVADDDIMDRFKEIKKIHKRHRGAAEILMQ